MDQGQQHELVVIAFNAMNKAAEVLNVLQQLDKENVVELKNAATIVRNTKGEIDITETREYDTKKGAIAGAVAGGLLGLLVNKMGLIDKVSGKHVGIWESGSMGAMTGASMGSYLADKLLDLGFKDNYLKELAQELSPGSSALVAVIEFEKVEEAMKSLEPFKGKILRQTLPQEIADRLSDRGNP
jgi:uncharacterized membrane protein